MNKTYFLKYLFFALFLSQLFTAKLVMADLFDTCKFSKGDFQNTATMMKYSNSKNISSKIEDIQDENLQKAVYLALFYRDSFGASFTMPVEAIDIIGFENVRDIKNLKMKIANYMFEKQFSAREIEKTIRQLKFNGSEAVNLLLFGSFRQYVENDEFTGNFLNDLFYSAFENGLITPEQIKKLRYYYPNFVDDEDVMTQIRKRLWSKNTNHIADLIHILSTNGAREHANNLVNFYNYYHYRTSKVITKNGKSQKVYYAHTKQEILNECKRLANYDDLVDLMCLKKDPKNEEHLIAILNKNKKPTFMPSEWFNYKSYIAREAINNGEDLQEAYNLVQNCGDLTGDGYYKQQFLLGLLSYLDKDYQTSSKHFKNCAENSKFAESNAKANYWLAMSYEKLGNTGAKNNALEVAGKNTLTLYGQMALEDLGEDPEDFIYKTLTRHAGKKSMQNMCDDVQFLASYILQRFVNKNDQISTLTLNYVNNNHENKQKLQAVADVYSSEFGIEVNMPLSVYLNRYNVGNRNVGFPVNKYTNDSLVNAIIKKETNFKKNTQGSKGERGLMQIMPGTAKKIAQMLSMKYDSWRLLVDENYNVHFGSMYIEYLLDMFDNHKLLALASYNAGSGNVKKWIEKNGDPRQMDKNSELAVWIELIPFSFTRGYATTILGNEMVYDVIERMEQGG